MTRKQSRPTTTLPDYVMHLTVSTHTFLPWHAVSVDKTAFVVLFAQFLSRKGQQSWKETKSREYITVKCWSSIVKEQINWETLINEFDKTLFAENASSETQRQCWKGSRTTDRCYWLMSKDFVKILIPRTQIHNTQEAHAVLLRSLLQLNSSKEYLHLPTMILDQSGCKTKNN